MQRAARAGVKALALTDHDTVLGLVEAEVAALDLGLELVPGLELSTTHQDCSLHVLGFYPDLGRLNLVLEERRQARIRRAQRMVEKLSALGLPIPFPEAAAPGRVHIARALVLAGHVRDEREAFDRYLADHRPAYEPYEKLSAPDGVSLLADCVAVPVWAHPLLFRGGPTETVLAELVAAGLQGIEVYRPEITHSQQERLLKLAQQYGLIVTGGTDFHGTAVGDRGEVELNTLHLPLTLLDQLKGRSRQLQAV